MNTPFVKQHKLREILSSQIPDNGRGVGGKSERVAARLEALHLGRFTIPSFVAALSIDTEGALTVSDNDGPIGNEILSRFKITLDYSRRRMWLEPNSHLADGFANDMSGIEFEAGGDDCRAFKITGVAKKSPAAEAGIQPGDEIIAIDDRPAKQFTSEEIYKLLMVDGAEHSLALKRANQPLQVRIKLRPLL
jgi:predicted metalloprotease with PDZ domain